MFRRFLFLLVSSALFLLFINYSYAAPAYGTHMPEKRHWTWGVEGNFILDRNLDNEEGGVEVDKYFITGSYGIFEWLSFDGKIGVGNADWHRTKGNDSLSYDTNFAGAYGFRIKGYEIEEWGIKSVVGFQHISVHPDAKNQGSNKHEAIIDEWQGSVAVSKDIGNFVPYIGARYGTVDFIKWVDEHDRKRIQSEDYYGVIVGLDYWLSERMKLNMEGGFLDGEELAIGISYDF
jgi:opacity protein-like surface antigen